jgi:threonine dehydratase
MTWPIGFRDVLEARRRLAPHLRPTALRGYPTLDAAVGHGIRVLVKHDNHQPTCAFKVRNNLSVVTALSPEERRRGLVAATRGNHGQGLAYAGALLGAPVVVCVPVGNNPDKNAAVESWGAELVESGRDYDESVQVAAALVKERGMRLVHSTNDPLIIAGAATMTLEILEEAPDLDALVLAVGGGSQAVGALVVARALRPDLPVFAVQAAKASAIHDSYRQGRPLALDSARTWADGLATRSAYELTFGALREGLADFVTVSEEAMADAVRLALHATHQLVEGAGAAGLAGLLALRERLAGKRVGIAFSGANIDRATLRTILDGGTPAV